MHRLFSLKRYLPILILCGVIALFFSFGGHHWLTLERLSEHKDLLQSQVSNNPLLSILLFVLLYVAVVAASLPGAILFSLTAGFLFGQWLGTAIVVTGATVGAVLLFVLVQTAFGETLKSKAGPWFAKISAGFQNNAVSYMLFLRLVPLFPFFAVNIAGAMMGVRLPIFILTTAMGIIPGSFVFVSAGVGLDAVIKTGNILNDETKIAFIGLGLISLVPVLYRYIKSR